MHPTPESDTCLLIGLISGIVSAEHGWSPWLGFLVGITVSAWLLSIVFVWSDPS